MSDTPKIQPALSPEAWEKATALALYGQPFGFTREDVTALRSCAAALDEEHGWPSPYGLAPDPLRSLADRLEALLPPSNE